MIKLKKDMWVEDKLGGDINDLFWHITIDELDVSCEIIRENPRAGKYQVSFYLGGKQHAIKRTKNSSNKESIHKFDSLAKAKQFGEQKLSNLIGLVVDENMQKLWKVVDKYIDGDLEHGDTLFAK